MTFDPDDPVGSVFAPIIGLPTWNVSRGYASFLTFEFGVPSLRVREAYASPSANSRVRARAERRVVTVRGAWHLWIHSCDWKVLQAGEVIGHSEGEDETLERAAAALDGQILTGVVVEPANGASRFTFDLGGVLETTRWADEEVGDGEQWLLFTPSEEVLSIRADGHYSWHPGSTPPDQEIWRPLPELV